MSWLSLIQYLDDIYHHSTYVGKTWLAVFIICRIVLFTNHAVPIYQNEQGEFTCDTDQPGCVENCYDTLFPVPFQHFWGFQNIVVVFPSILYLIYVVTKTTRKERADVRNQRTVAGAPRDEERQDIRKCIKKDGLMPCYVAQLLMRSILEVVFTALQLYRYGVTVLNSYKCSASACGYEVDCFVTLYELKTYVLYYTYAVSCLGLAIDIWEMIYLCIGTRRRQPFNDVPLVEEANQKVSVTMSWGLLTRLLDEIYHHSTFVGKVWLTVLIIFRIVLIVVGGEPIYNDEQSTFSCDSTRPSCVNKCYDDFAPLSHVRFSVFQVILVTMPSVTYLVYALNRIPVEEQANDETIDMAESENGVKGGDATKADAKVRHDGRHCIKKDGLMPSYVAQLLVRAILEVAFLITQYYLYGLTVPELYMCSSVPCHRPVRCYVSRSAEKTTFLIIMYCVSFLCLAINIWEMCYLSIFHWSKTTGRGRPSDDGPLGRVSKREGNNSSSSPPPEYNVIIEALTERTRPPGRILPSTENKKACRQNSVNAALEERLSRRR
ncbi:gap junction alpha-4 protein-like isoform X2 [Vanacampus margaritifer]